MTDIDPRTKELYDQFKGFPPKHSVVRQGQDNDAFCLVVFEILFQNYHQVKKLDIDQQDHRELVAASIVPPPDDYIDIFFEEKDLDDCRYHIVQVKNSELAQADIETCFTMMEKSIDTYLKKPKDLKKNLKEVISNTDFSKDYKKQCEYYVVHRGATNFIRGQKRNWKIITEEELKILEKGTRLMSVPEETFEIDTANNFIINNFLDDQRQTQKKANIPESLLCNFSGYDLAVLNNKYSNTLLGRNILYGQNLREALNKSSKTFEKMLETVEKEPELFLYYNNGITILTSSFDAKKQGTAEIITVKDFSIINGAQTTSTLGEYLRQATLDNDLQKVEKLRNVYVLTKMYQINSELKNHERISERIKIYTNTQTPLSSRDMVSIRKEQIELQERFFHNEAPNIFIFIKKGEAIPAYPKTLPHQRITNERLAQLILCSSYASPFTAKDKKAKIFDIEGGEDFTLNQVYHKIFDQDEGMLFRISKYELDELLFIYKLHEDAKKHQKKVLQDMVNKLNQTTAKNEVDKATRDTQIEKVKRQMEIANICLLFNIACYYEIRRQFDSYVDDIRGLMFDHNRYYDNKDNYKKELISSFIEIFYNKTIDIIRRQSGSENTTNWLRSEKNEKVFLDELRNMLVSEVFPISEKYQDFVKKYKIACALYGIKQTRQTSTAESGE